MKVLVTGGTGLVGSAIKELRPDWIYIGGPDGQMNKKAIPGPGDFPVPVVSLEDGIRETVEWFDRVKMA